MFTRTFLFFFFFNDTATTEIYTLSLHDALPIFRELTESISRAPERIAGMFDAIAPRYDLLNHLLSAGIDRRWRSEEHTSELQSQSNLVCRLLLEKKKTPIDNSNTHSISI